MFQLIAKGSLLFFCLLLFTQIGFSQTLCSQEPDEFVVSCTIPERYFIQKFTCLNEKCSAYLTNNGSFLELNFPLSNEKSVILHNNIELRDIYRNLDVLQELCEEPISQNVIKELDLIISSQFSASWSTFSGERLTITPATNQSKLLLEQEKAREQRTISNCYETDYRILENWIIESKQKRSYCNLLYNDEQTCFQTQFSTTGFVKEIYTKPTLATLPYSLGIIVVFLILVSAAMLSFHLKKEKKLKSFFTPTTTSIVINSLIIIPFIYLYGIFIGSLINVQSRSLDIFLQLLLLFIGIVFVYYVSCLLQLGIRKVKRIRKKL